MDRFHRITEEASEYDDVLSIEKKMLNGEGIRIKSIG
jgi:hypothetical protein